MVGSMQIEERAREYAEKSFAQRIKIPEEEITERQKSRIMNGYVAVYTKIATEQKAIDEDAIHAIVEEQVLKAIEKQKAIDIDTLPQLYVRWLMIDGEKPSWVEYATKAMEG